MSKVLKIVAIAASLAAAVVTLGVSLGISAAILSAVALGASVGASLLAKKPSAPDNSAENINRLRANIDVRTPRKTMIGRTATNTDIRDEEFTDSQGYFHRFIVAASHKVSAISEVWFDDKLAWTVAGGVQGIFVGYLTVTPILEGSAANAINISARMGSTRRYTGCAYVYLRYKLTGATSKVQSPFAQSITTRITIRGDGALLYDPRLDTTAGGSGSQRADNQSTWVWNADACRNPALALLFYLLGWRITNPVTSAQLLVVGKGIPKERIDLASFIVAANLCDEAVTKLGGGTEPRYRCDGAWSEGDSPTTVMDTLKACMNADLDDVDGKLRLTVFHNDLATPEADFTDADVLGEFDWTPAQPLDQSFNVVRGIYTDASDTSLYQPVDYPQVEETSQDGIDRIDTFDLPMVQSAGQAQRLAQLRLMRQKFGGTFTAAFQATAWAVQKNSVIRLTFAARGFTTKLFRVAEMELRTDGTVPLVLREENTAIYGVPTLAAPVAPVTASAYDPALNPIIGEITDVAARTEKGRYSAATTYRAGNWVDVANGSTWVYINVVASAGNAPPTWPTTSNAWWSNLTPPTSYADGTLIDVLKPAEVGATLGATYGTNVYSLPTAIAPAAILVGGKLDAGQVLYSGGGPTVVSLQPGEAGANVTETRTAAFIAGQAATATSSDFSVLTGATKPESNATSGDNLMANAMLRGGATLWTNNTNYTLTTGVAGDPAFKYWMNNHATANATILWGYPASGQLPKGAGTLYISTDIKGTTGAVTDIYVLFFNSVGTNTATTRVIFVGNPAGGGWSTVSGKIAIPAGSTSFSMQVVCGAGLGFAAMRVGITEAGATLGAVAGTNIFQTNGTTILTQAEIRTIEGTAAAITGQAATATSSDFSAVTGTTKPESNADVTLLVTGGKTVTIGCDYTGAVKSGQLPVDINFKATSAAGTDVTTSASWSATLKSGTATFTPTVAVPNATGTLNITALSTDAVIEMKATYSGKVRTNLATLIKQLDAPPVGGAGGAGTSASTSTISSSTTASYGAANTSILSVVAGTAGQVACSFPDRFKLAANGTGDCYGKWQWRVVGGTFADITTEIASTVSAYKAGTPEPANDAGNLSCNMTKTGLTSGTTYEFQCLLRSAGAYTVNHFGTASAVGS